MRSKILGIFIITVAVIGAGLLISKNMYGQWKVSLVPHSAHASAAPTQNVAKAPVTLPPFDKKYGPRPTSTAMQKEATSTDNLSPASLLKPVVPQTSQTYTVNQPVATWPKIVQATINPPDVHVGMTQNLSIVLEDDAQITVVDALIQTDHGTTTIALDYQGQPAANTLVPQKFAVDDHNQLVAVDGNNNGAVNIAYADLVKQLYSGQWIVKDTHDTYYKTTFLVEDAKGRQNTITLDWSDACGIPNSGSATISSNCTISSLDGVQGGNLTVATGTTMTLNSEFAVTSGNSAFIHGSLVMGGSGSLKFETLYMVDADGDGYPASLTVYNATGTGRVARASIAHPTIADCNDSNASQFNSDYTYNDNDNDGYGNPSTGGWICDNGSPYAGQVFNNTDCDDTNASHWQYLGGYADNDNDGYGAGSFISNICSGSSLPTGYASNNTDCDDTHATVHQIVSVGYDADHDGYTTSNNQNVCVGNSTTINGRTYYMNNLGAYSDVASGQSLGSDCDDSDANAWMTSSPGQFDTDVDQDGWAGVGLYQVCYGTSYNIGGRTYVHADSGYGLVLTASQALGWDCNDDNASVYYNFAEYHDYDNDGYGAGSYVLGCGVYPPSPDSGYSLNSNDCDDSDANVNPGQNGWFTSSGGNGWDYNCSGGTDYEYNYGSGSCTGQPDSSCPGGPYPGACQSESTGWYGGAPSCGSAGLYLSANGTADYECNNSYYLTQGCH